MSYVSKLTIPININRITKFSKNNKRPGCNMFVKQYKDSVIKQHRKWKDAGRPSQGLLFNMRKKSRYQYYQAIKFIKNYKNKIIKFKIANSLKCKKLFKILERKQKYKRIK